MDIAGALHFEVFAEVHLAHLGVGDDLVWRAFVQDAAFVQEHDAVADFLDVAHVVRGVEHGHAILVRTVSGGSGIRRDAGLAIDSGTEAEAGARDAALGSYAAVPRETRSE